ncbi:MAG: Gfo/Idh/MocA family oxidoreductase [Oscillospiraceae bacterium]|jgi:predicted dehydrogenase|nr:Gfo/Idh/MocA family oxidoreductase [Oscillospiraceae bacterium]
MREKFNWAYIGAGGIARSTAKQILKTGQHRIVSVWNRNPQRAAEFGKKFGAVPCATIAQAVDRPDVQGVYIATTHNHHYAAARECLLLGKPVLVEKAFTVTRAQAQELVALAREKGVYLAEAMWTWYSPVARQVKAWCGEIGEIKNIQISFCTRIPRSADRVYNPNTAGGALLDIGVYPLTYLYNLLGKPEHVTCKGTLRDGADVDEVVTLDYANGLRVPVTISLTRDISEKLIITGTQGEIRCPFFHCTNKATLVQGRRKTRFKGDGGYGNEFSVVADEIRQGQTESRYVPLENTVEIMGILDECRRQMGLKYPFEE